jgi:hypothetical protein
MQFVSACSNYATHVKAFVKKGPRLSFGPFVRFLVTDKEFDLLGEKAADRRFSTGS